MLPIPGSEFFGSAAHVANLSAAYASRFICVARHVEGDRFGLRIVAAL